MRTMVLALLLLSGCAAASHKVVAGPNGPAYAIDCRRSVANCYDEAGRLCPRGYVFLDRTSNGTVIAPVGNAAVAVPLPDSILVECKAPAAQAAR